MKQIAALTVVNGKAQLRGGSDVFPVAAGSTALLAAGSAIEVEQVGDVSLEYVLSSVTPQ